MLLPPRCAASRHLLGRSRCLTRNSAYTTTSKMRTMHQENGTGSAPELALQHPEINLGSDNFAGAHPDVAASLAKYASGFATPYGHSSLDRTVQARFNDVFEREVAVFFVATGTASNSLALTSMARPGGYVLAHHEAHIIADECGAPEFLSGQLRTSPVGGSDGKMAIPELRKQARRIAGLDVHGGRLSAISVTQPTESGTVYTLQELDEIGAIAKEQGVQVHMDGARFANGLAALGCTPAEMTWKRGVDILSFGATKNGCWCAEAVVFFDPEKARDFPFLRKRAAQLFSKSRFVSAQLEAYLYDDLWLKTAQHANKMADELAKILKASTHMRLARHPQTNEVFAVVDKSTIKKLETNGIVFYQGWPASPDLNVGDDELLCRFVTSFATTAEDIERFGQLAQ